MPKITASVSQTHQRLQLILATEITTSVSQTLQLLSTNHHITTSTFNHTSHYNFCQPDTTLLLLSKHHITTSEHSVEFIVFLPHTWGMGEAGGQVATDTTLYSIYRALTLIVRGRLLLTEHSLYSIYHALTLQVRGRLLLAEHSTAFIILLPYR